MADMTPEEHAAVGTLNKLAYELGQREKWVRKQLDYYGGKHKLAYASPEFSEYFGARFKGFTDNWCAPVVNSPAERMNVLGVQLDDEQREVDKDLARVWRANDCDRGSSEAISITLATGRSFATVWGNPDDEDTPVVTFERPDQAIIQYGDMRQRIAGMRLWRDDQHEYATLDDGRFLWKFKRSAMQDGRLRSGLVVPSSAIGGWQPREVDDEPWPLPNPLGEVSMVELPNHSLLDMDNPISDIDGVIAMQDAINLVWAYLMNALDYASLPQRVVMGADMPEVPILDSEGRIVGKRPLDLNQLVKDRVLWIPGSSTNKPTIGEWSAANLEVFSKVIEYAIEHISAQTRTPPHYLIGKIQNVSADALTAAETGLVSKTGERITYLSPGTREIFRLIARAQGNEAKANAVRSGRVIWGDVQFRALSQKVDALAKLRGIGFPLEWIAEQYGLTPPEVERLMQMRERELRDSQLDELVAAGERLAADPEPKPEPDEAELQDA